jgi:hypothetical protein
VLAHGYFPVHSVFRNLHLLKWAVTGSETMEHFYRLVDRLGRDAGLKPLYLRRSIGARVTALLEIDPKEHAELSRVPIPDPLFVVERLAVTRIIGPKEYELVGEVYL